MIFKWLAERRRRKEQERRQQLFGAPVYERADVQEAQQVETERLQGIANSVYNRRAATEDGPFLDFKRRYPSPFEDDNERD